jgi:hypothetical protein
MTALLEQFDGIQTLTDVLLLVTVVEFLPFIKIKRLCL